MRHGCFCAHPYLVRLLGLRGAALDAFHAAARRHERRALPGAVRASAGLSTTLADIDRFVAAVEVIAATRPPVEYAADPVRGDYWPVSLPRADAGRQVRPCCGMPAETSRAARPPL